VNAADSLVLEGACTGGKFVAHGLAVKQHGAILGMQMHRNRTGCGAALTLS